MRPGKARAGENRVSISTTTNQPLVAPPPLPAPLPLDPTEALLDAPVGAFVEGRSGDVCSLLGIVGAATMALNRRSPSIEHVGERIVLGSMMAGGADTLVQSRNVIAGGDGPEERGNPHSDKGSIAYAATGLIPAASVGVFATLKPGTGHRDVVGLGLLALNTGVLGYELITRGPKIASGEEDLSGYGSLVASFGGFVVAQHIVRH